MEAIPLLPTSILDLMYIVASIFFIFGLKMLGKSKTARKGNFVSALGMLIAIVTALLSDKILHWEFILAGVVLGSVVGALASRLVKMTAMPEMVALFNGFGGLSSLLVSWAEYQKVYASGEPASVASMLIIIITVFIGGVTFTGSIIAWGKLSGKVDTKPFMYKGQQVVNGFILVFILAIILFFGPLKSFLPAGSFLGLSKLYWVLIEMVIISFIFGILFVIPIGGGDMPVVISLLNSFSGMAACAAGFVISNNVLIVAGALVGSSGIILTNIMCKAMNRSLVNVLFSGFGSGSTASKGTAVQGEVKAMSAEDAYLVLEAASNVLVVPGYGMAVAQAQHVVQELANLLEDNGAEVNFGIHPVAGRMPGHMNVLLAEANVEYDKLKEMDDVNPTIENVDVAIVIGANDVVNPAANEDKGSPLYGMPVINVDKARTVMVLKRSMNPGFAGVENPLFFKDNTRMIFGDAKDTIQSIVNEFKD